MKKVLTIICIAFFASKSFAQVKTIHVYVALCDNEFQGIVPVPTTLGNGKDPKNNLYWGALYGVKTHFKKSTDWQLVKTIKSTNSNILERLLYKHTSKDVYMLADAYDGEKIKNCIEDFLKSSNGQKSINVDYNSTSLSFGGGAGLLAYVGHDGLMEFQVDIDYNTTSEKKDVIMLACYSKDYFKNEISNAKANPILWTTGLMAPEAYTLKAAIDGWIDGESGKEIDERAAQSYHKY